MKTKSSALDLLVVGEGRQVIPFAVEKVMAKGVFVC